MLLDVRQLTKSFDGLLALSNVSFTVKKGDVVGLIGPNGSGKSTAFNIVAGTFPPTSGQVLLEGKDITGLPAHQVSARGIARSFQLVRPFLHLTALQNVMAGRMYGHEPVSSTRQAKTEAMEILAFIGLAEKNQTKAGSLTVMERKWLELGRALATRPDLVGLEAAQNLLTLQDSLPPVPFAEIEAEIARSFARAPETLFASIDPVPIGSASIAQVHRAVTSEGCDVAIKVLRPGIRERFARDIATYEWAAAHLEALGGEAERLRPRQTIANFKRWTNRELDLRREAASAS